MSFYPLSDGGVGRIRQKFILYRQCLKTKMFRLSSHEENGDFGAASDKET